MAIGYQETSAKGLRVYNMDTFDHPGLPLGDSKCGKIYCTWKTDGGGSHTIKKAETFYEQMTALNAKEVGVLGEASCEEGYKII